jgi:hypothetical protein
MNLYIQIQDGQPWQHPLLEDNVLQAWPGIDLNNLPSNLAKFRRFQQPSVADMPVGNFQVAVCTYELASDGVYEDAWTVREMDDDEKRIATKAQKKSVADQLESLKSFAIERIENTTGDVQNAWQTYSNLLNSLDTSDPFNVAWPAMPRIDEDGDLII